MLASPSNPFCLFSNESSHILFNLSPSFLSTYSMGPQLVLFRQLYFEQVSPHFHEKELIFFSQGLGNVREEKMMRNFVAHPSKLLGEKEAVGVANELKICLSVMPLRYWQSSRSRPGLPLLKCECPS